jgi:hypothetical protein
MKTWLFLITLLGLAPPVAAQPYQPPAHHLSPPMLTVGTPDDVTRRADAGVEIELDRSPAAELDQHRRFDHALAGLLPQRHGIVDAYVLVVALDSDPVFGREARVAGDVLQRRFGALGRTIVLAGSDGSGSGTLARGTPETLAVALARIAELMDRSEDVLILYTTGHGAPYGLYYHDADSGYGLISPNRLANMLNGLGLRNRLLILSACYSGIFVPALESDTTAIVTAASAVRTSFGCVAQNDWTFFGDAMINHALRSPQPLASVVAEADRLVAGWEADMQALPSQPQFSAGPETARWLGILEQHIPPATTAPVGRPALASTRAAGP